MTTAVSTAPGRPRHRARTTTTPAAKCRRPASADRFLKLLVTQMQNQDPLNPMDNAQVTSQMAQINTVTGLEKVNESVKALGGQFCRCRRCRARPGRPRRDRGRRPDRLCQRQGPGGFELQGPADDVKVEILDASGAVVDTLAAGRSQARPHSFDWAAGTASPTTAACAFASPPTLGGTTTTAPPR
jgi:flagellar basal-body rod modification protein FlgD